MSYAWRFLFETIQYQLLPHTDSGLGDSKLTEEERSDVAALALTEAARVLKRAEDYRFAELENMWRFWADMSSASLSRRTRDTQATTHGQLTVAIVAGALARACGSGTDLDGQLLPRGDIQSISRRLDLLAEMSEFPDVFASAYGSGESTPSGLLWHQFATEVMVDRVVSVIEGLNTGLLRLAVFWMFMRGAGSFRASGDWMRNVTDEQIDPLVAEVAGALDRETIVPRSDAASVAQAIKALKPRAERMFAVQVATTPISADRLHTLTNGLLTAWSEQRQAKALLEAAGARCFEDLDPESTSRFRTNRAFLVPNTNYVGEEMVGEDLGRYLARREMRIILQSWVDAVPDGPPISADHFAQTLEQWANPSTPIAIVAGISWEASEWARANEVMLEERNLRFFTTGLLGDDNVLLVDASEQEWHLVAIPSDRNLVIDELPLESDATEAHVELVYPDAKAASVGPADVTQLVAPWNLKSLSPDPADT